MIKHLMRPSDRKTYPAGAKSYAPNILAAWLRAFPESKPADRDKEDWIENACFIEVFKNLGLDYDILEPSTGASVSSTSNGIRANSGRAAFFHTGISAADQVKGVDYSLPLQTQGSIDAIMEHATSETFRKYAGRDMVLARPNGKSVSEAVRKIVPESGEIFLKTIKKEYARKFTIEADIDPWKQICEQDEDLPWMIMHYDGSESPYFSIQGVIAPTFEYRMFMVGNEPVTGAGCIEAYTPVDNLHLFDAKMEEVRNQSEVESQTDIVDRYIAFAAEFGKNYAHEHGSEMAYSLDLCIDAKTGNVVPIELNPPFDLGRYASRVDVWVKAIDILMNRIAGNDQ